MVQIITIFLKYIIFWRARSCQEEGELGTRENALKPCLCLVKPSSAMHFDISSAKSIVVCFHMGSYRRLIANGVVPEVSKMELKRTSLRPSLE